MIFSSARLLTIKRDALFSCSQSSGDMTEGAEGVFVHDTRHLSRMVLTVAGVRPEPLAWSDAPGHTATVRLAQGHDLLVERRRTIEGDFVERITLENFGPATDVTVALELGCDMADIFAIRGWAEAAGPVTPAVRSDGLRFARTGRDGVERTTEVTLDPAPGRVAPAEGHHRCEWDLALPARARREIVVSVDCGPHHEPSTPAVEPTLEPTGSDALDGALASASRDLAMLQTPIEGGSFIAAGIPWYVALFGRDSLLTAYALLDSAPEVARDTLDLLAAHQATSDDPNVDAEEGKILHEHRRGELSGGGPLGSFPYYGTVDATPLFVLLAAEHALRTGNVAGFDARSAHVEAALRWIDEHADDRGFVRYLRRSNHGLVNQGWKDSADAIVGADGAQVNGSIALCEVQGYVYAAKARLADLFEQLGRTERAVTLRGQAASLRAAFRASFWMDDLDCFALALDGEGTQVRSVTSNAGHCLWSGIVHDDLAARLARRLMAPDMFSGWGLRTLSAESPAYNPMSYHRGSVWPHDSALVAAGLSRYGFTDHALRIRDALVDLAQLDRAGRLPELLCGFERVPGEPHVAYPQTCLPQAWAAASVFLLATLHN